MVTALNPGAAARQAYAARNVAVSKSGKVTIGTEFRAELIDEGFTSEMIETALGNAPKYIEGTNPEKWMKTVRTALGWARNAARSADAKMGSTQRGHSPKTFRR
jgi:hypothetical protein